MGFDGLIRAAYGDLYGMAAQQKDAGAKISDSCYQMANQHQATIENFWDPSAQPALIAAQHLRSQGDASATSSEAQAAATNQSAGLYQDTQARCASQFVTGT